MIFAKLWMSGRSGKIGVAVSSLLLVCCCAGMATGQRSDARPVAATIATPTAIVVEIVTAAPPTSTARATSTSAPTRTTIPPTPTAAPPISTVLQAAHLRAGAGAGVDMEDQGTLCVNDTVSLRSQRLVDAVLWYNVHVDTPGCATLNSVDGWVRSDFVSQPSASVSAYLDQIGQDEPAPRFLPTNTPAPTATPRPVIVVRATAAPVAPSSGGGRTGAICRDGTRSRATGRGACSHHGGVARWLY